MASVEQEIAALDALASADLRDAWRRLTGAAAPRISPSMLRLALAHEIQTRALGGLPRTTRQKLAQLGRAKTSTTPATPGMRLVREWNGTLHVVTIGEDSLIRWNDRNWGSLSEVARAITGTRWSGPAFVG